MHSRQSAFAAKAAPARPRRSRFASSAEIKKPAGFPAGFCVISKISVGSLRADSGRAVQGTVMVEVMHVVNGPH